LPLDRRVGPLKIVELELLELAEADSIEHVPDELIREEVGRNPCLNKFSEAAPRVFPKRMYELLRHR